MSKISAARWGTLACLVIAASLTACAVSPRPSVAIKIVSQKPDAQITLDTNSEQVLIDIVSPSGIGNAEFEITSPARPKKIILRLHLRGLEELQFDYGKTVVIGSISSGPGNRIRQHRRSANSNDLQPILPNSPDWMKMEVVAQDGAPTSIPLERGYIQVEAPQDFVQGQVRRFYIRWVDFYR